MKRRLLLAARRLREDMENREREGMEVKEDLSDGRLRLVVEVAISAADWGN